MIPARKRWGQHFLVSEATAERIVEAAGIAPEDTVIEVGPGEGALTRLAARRAARLLAVEIDPPRARRLAEEFTSNPGVRIMEGDVLSSSFSEWLAEAGWSGPAVLLGNLPYNVATPILLSAIEDPGTIRRAVATVQKEVARRFVARAGEEGYGFLSVRAAAWARARILFDLPPGAFRPRPRVTSSVLELTPRRAEPVDAPTRAGAVSLASLGFRSRRKTLANALASAGRRTTWEAALERIGKSPRARAEELSFEDYLALARAAAAR
jgi:16S rRNA (adenine1518-N6/adenine1519-N6)-dimethyltransferase